MYINLKITYVGNKNLTKPAAAFVFSLGLYAVRDSSISLNNVCQSLPPIYRMVSIPWAVVFALSI